MSEVANRASSGVQHLRVTATSAKFVGRTREEFQAACEFVGEIARAWQWWAGDLMLTAEVNWGEEGYQAEAFLGKNEEALQRCLRVAKHVPPAIRRAELSFAHHDVVATSDLTPEQREALLAEAVAKRWTSAQLREAKLSELGRLPKPESESRTRNLPREIRGVVRHWQQAAEDAREEADELRRQITEAGFAPADGRTLERVNGRPTPTFASQVLIAGEACPTCGRAYEREEARQ